MQAGITATDIDDDFAPAAAGAFLQVEIMRDKFTYHSSWRSGGGLANTEHTVCLRGEYSYMLHHRDGDDTVAGIPDLSTG